MADERDRQDRSRPARDAERGEPGGGAGRRDEAGGSGVYPASAGHAPEDAFVRTPGEWGSGAGGEEGGSSELRLTEEQIRAARQDAEAAGDTEPDEERQ